jgi:hypothetical protein
MMLLKSLVLSSVPPFEGLHRMEFAVDAHRPVTVIIGNCGSGKTTICRAIRFALSGVEDLAGRIPPNAKGTASFVEIGLAHGVEDILLRRDRPSAGRPSATRLTATDSSSKQQLLSENQKMAVATWGFANTSLADIVFFEGEQDFIRRPGEPGSARKVASIKPLLSEATASAAGAFATELLGRFSPEHNPVHDSHVIVTPSNPLEPVSLDGARRLACLSAGEARLVSLAFVVGASKAISGDSKEGFPLVTDQVFNVLTSEIRQAILRELPSLLPQWILLANPAEFQGCDMSSFVRNNVGRAYMLEQSSAGKTAIYEIDTGAMEDLLT